MHLVLRIPAVRPNARREFMRTWGRVGGTVIRDRVDDDELFFAGLRKLLPEAPLSSPQLLYRRAARQRAAWSVLVVEFRGGQPVCAVWRRPRGLADRAAARATALCAARRRCSAAGRTAD